MRGELRGCEWAGRREVRVGRVRMGGVLDGA
jgi:hypothetical protein